MSQLACELQGFSTTGINSLTCNSPSLTVSFGLIEPPKFVKKLDASKVAKQGESIQLECKISGSPEIKVAWFRNDSELHESWKYNMSFVNSVALLTINEASAEDSGDYICEAHNGVGDASCSTALKVKGQTPLLLLLLSNGLLMVHLRLSKDPDVSSG